MDGEAGWWTTSGNIGLPPLATVMGVGRQQQQMVKSVSIEFKSEYNKWMVLRNKSDLRETEEYKRVLEQDVSIEEREKRKERIQESKVEWVMRGEIYQREKTVEKTNPL